MELAVDLMEFFGGDVSVDFGGADIGVAEEFLDDAEVGAIFQKVGGEAVAEHVWSDVALDAAPESLLFDAQPKGNRGEFFAAMV